MLSTFYTPADDSVACWQCAHRSGRRRLRASSRTVNSFFLPFSMGSQGRIIPLLVPYSTRRKDQKIPEIEEFCLGSMFNPRLESLVLGNCHDTQWWFLFDKSQKLNQMQFSFSYLQMKKRLENLLAIFSLDFPGLIMCTNSESISNSSDSTYPPPKTSHSSPNPGCSISKISFKTILVSPSLSSLPWVSSPVSQPLSPAK